VKKERQHAVGPRLAIRFLSAEEGRRQLTIQYSKKDKKKCRALGKKKGRSGGRPLVLQKCFSLYEGGEAYVSYKKKGEKGGESKGVCGKSSPSPSEIRKGPFAGSRGESNGPFERKRRREKGMVAYTL